MSGHLLHRFAELLQLALVFKPFSRVIRPELSRLCLILGANRDKLGSEFRPEGWPAYSTLDGAQRGAHALCDLALADTPLGAEAKRQALSIIPYELAALARAR